MNDLLGVCLWLFFIEKIDTTNVKAKMKKAQNMEDAFAKPIDVSTSF